MLLAVFFSAITLYAINRFEKARFEIEQNNIKLAHEEIILAVSQLINSIDDLSLQIANWDEVFQQLDNPAYYSYWRTHRIFAAKVLPDYIQSAEVFDVNGKALALQSDSGFPEKIDTSQLTTFITLKKGSSNLYMYLPVKRQSNSPVKGYLGLHIPFIKALTKQHHFHFLDADTLYIKAQENIKISLSDAISMMNFIIKTSPETETMMNIVKTSMLQLSIIVGIICLLFYFLMVYLLGKPLVEISSYIDRLSYSNPESLVPAIRSRFQVAELEKVRTSLSQYHVDLEKAQKELDNKNRELWDLAHHDTLTGMQNRRAFEMEWKKSRQVLSNHRVGIGLLLFDINHFKAINDSYGHQIGDEVLISISACIQKALRKAEQLFRIGGDEFAAIIIGITPQEEVLLAQRCMDMVNQHDFRSMGLKETVRVSCGISHCQADELEQLDNLQWQADIAVYQAKRPGVTRPVLFDSSMVDGHESVFSSWMSNAIYEAIANGKGIEIHYQPIVNSISGKTGYYEALLRIRHEGELIPPSHIFPVVTMRHMETEMDRTIINKIIEDLQQSFIVKGSGVSVNLSAESIVHQNVIEWLLPLADFIKDYQIIIEVTETSLITQLSTASGNLKKLRKLGFKIALDDFGSGYSSLRYLTSMPVDTIKFDISLIQGMLDKRLAKLVTEMASMLTGLGYELIAEGIETEELLKKVVAAGFNYSQGYFFGAPSRQTQLLPVT